MTSPFRRLAGGAVVLVALSGQTVPALAQGASDAQWRQYGFDNADGARTHHLSFAIPETDAWLLDARCTAGDMGPAVPVMLALDFGARKNGDEVEVRFRTKAYDATFAGTVSIESEEYAGVGIEIGVEDAFWQALRRGYTLHYGLPGEEARSMSLRGSNDPIRRFLGHCREIFAATDANATPAQEGPFAYTCEDGTTFRLTVDNSRSYSVATVTANGKTTTLVQAPSGSGTLYSNDALEVHTKGDEALMITPQETIRCSRAE